MGAIIVGASVITVLLPTYNSAEIIGRSIRSILQQTFSEFELLIVDDGSTDATADVIRRFRDRRIRYLPCPHRGLPETLNTGLREARYDVIARMDAGDVSVPARLEKQFAELSALSPTAVIGCHFGVFSGGRLRYVVESGGSSAEIRRRLALHSVIVHSGSMYRRSLVLESGGYRDVPLEDYDLWLRVKHRAEFSILGEVLHFWENAPNRLSTADLEKKWKNHYLLQEKYYTDLQREFMIEGSDEQAVVRGWREYFYGEKKAARQWWNQSPQCVILSIRLMTAYCFTFLPEQYFRRIKESRLRFRIRTVLRIFSADRGTARRQFAALMREP